MNTTVTPRSTPISKIADVLLIDDDDLVLRALSRLLVARGYTVRATSDGRSAIRDILGGGYDCVISDISMPDMTGLELVAVLKSYECETPVILMTGRPDFDTAQEAIEHGVVQYLTKPVDGDTVCRALGRALGVGSRAGRDELKDESFARALDSLFMVFQPIVSVSKKRAIGYEALVRSKEPGFERPHDLFAHAERSRQLVELGRLIRDRCARSITDLPADSSLFVNLNAEELMDAELFSPTSALALHASRVVLEITERATIANVTDIVGRVSALRALGYRVAVDDLGAGYAGLTSVATLEPDYVKLDMTMTRDLDVTSVRARLVESIVVACNELRMQLVAEGVETIEDVQALSALHCDLVQGYYYGRPVPTFEGVAS